MNNLTEELQQQITASGMSVNALATKTGIPRVTLVRCLAKPEMFRLGDYLAVKEALANAREAA